MRRRLTLSLCAVAILASTASVAFHVGCKVSRDEQRVVAPAWSEPYVRPGDNEYSYALPFVMGGEKYLAVFQHRTERIATIVGWAVRVDDNDPAKSRERADWLLKHKMPRVDELTTPKPTSGELDELERELKY